MAPIHSVRELLLDTVSRVFTVVLGPVPADEENKPRELLWVIPLGIRRHDHRFVLLKLLQKPVELTFEHRLIFNHVIG